MDIRPNTVVRGMTMYGERPEEIAVVFNRPYLRNVARNKETQEKFMEWLLSEVYNALDDKIDKNG